jgi:hypothetical protein
MSDLLPFQGIRGDGMVNRYRSSLHERVSTMYCPARETRKGPLEARSKGLQTASVANEPGQIVNRSSATPDFFYGIFSCWAPTTNPKLPAT